MGRLNGSWSVAMALISMVIGFGWTPSMAADGAATQPSTQPSVATESGGRRTFDRGQSDDRAVALADRLIEALGGAEAWRRIPYLAFTFVVEREGKVVATRRHYWDRVLGRHRLEGTREGERYVVLTDVRGNRGTAYRDGERLSGEDAQKYLEAAYGAWINDTYWLAMPLKVEDPGVILKYSGSEVVDGKSLEKIQLRFDGVGLTPKDLYWAYLDPETGIMERWSFVLDGAKAEPTVAVWNGWVECGGVKLSTEKTVLGKGQRILFEDVECPAEIRDALFTEVGEPGSSDEEARAPASGE